MISIKELLVRILTAIKSVQPYQIRTVSATVNIGAKAGATFNLSVPSVSGYTPVGVVRFAQNHGNSVFITSMSSYNSLYLYNNYSSAQSTTLTVDILFLRNKVGGGTP